MDRRWSGPPVFSEGGVDSDAQDEAADVAAQRGTREHDVISFEDLQTINGGENLYDAVKKLRPHFLRSRGPTSSRQSTGSLPVVYIGPMIAGGLDVLRNIRPEHVLEVRYLDPSSATIRFGTNGGGGAIIVTLRSQ